jgi:hypothetical protein
LLHFKTHSMVSGDFSWNHYFAPDTNLIVMCGHLCRGTYSLSLSLTE